MPLKPNPGVHVVSPCLFTSGRQIHGNSVRSNDPIGWSPFRARLLRHTTPGLLLRHENRQTAHLSDQTVYLACLDDRGTLPMAMANRIVLQMDQTTSSHQCVLWNFRKCSLNPDLYCCICLRSCGDSRETAESRSQSLYHPSNSEPDSVQKRPIADLFSESAMNQEIADLERLPLFELFE